MTTDIYSLKANVKHWTLILGVLQITVGCTVGFIPPSAVAWFRGIVMAHIEFTANGVLMVAFGFLVRELQLSPAALKVWFATLQIGTWAKEQRALQQPSSALRRSSCRRSMKNSHHPAAPTIQLFQARSSCGVTIMVALLLTLYGLLLSKTSERLETISVDHRA